MKNTLISRFPKMIKITQNGIRTPEDKFTTVYGMDVNLSIGAPVPFGPIWKVSENVLSRQEIKILRKSV